jgi:hypothetical protein
LRCYRFPLTAVSIAALAASVALGGCAASSAPPDGGTGSCSVMLSKDDLSPMYVGRPYVFRATLSPECGAAPVVHFSTGLLNDAGAVAGYAMLRDYTTINAAHTPIQRRDYVSWTPMVEGSHRVRVRLKDSFSASEDRVVVDSDVQTVSPRATDTPTLTETNHPLVRLFSTPDCVSGTVSAEFAECLDATDMECVSRGPIQTTSELACGTGRTRNFFLAGMNGPGSAYVVRAQINGGNDPSLDESWHRFALTTPIPSTIRFLKTCVGDACSNAELKSHTTPPSGLSDRSTNIAWDAYNQLAFIENKNTASPVAKDVDGRLVWYWYPGASAPELADFIPVRPLQGGNFIVLASDANAPGPTVNADSTILRESNLAGDLAWETNVNILNARVKALDPGFSDIIGIHHDVLPLEGGSKLAILVRTIRLKIAPSASCPEYFLNPDGSALQYNWIGDGLVVVDREGAVLWKVDLMDRLPVDSRCFPGKFLSGGSRSYAVCSSPGGGECPVPGAKDYSHGNAIAEYGDDLLVSLRYQNWIVKLDYKSGTGNGNIGWKLGADGDFCTGDCEANCEPIGGGTCTRGAHPNWFSYQHFPRIVEDTENRLVLFDNSNKSCFERTDLEDYDLYACYLDGVRSRGQDWSLEFQDGMPGRASLELNVELPFFSYALGSAQRLRSGNYSFGTGFLQLDPRGDSVYSSSTEVALDDQGRAQVAYTYASEPPEGVRSGNSSLVYRSFRLRTMYDGP